MVLSVDILAVSAVALEEISLIFRHRSFVMGHAKNARSVLKKGTPTQYRISRTTHPPPPTYTHPVGSHERALPVYVRENDANTPPSPKITKMNTF